jgi:hypothetical protein
VIKNNFRRAAASASLTGLLLAGPLLAACGPAKPAATSSHAGPTTPSLTTVLTDMKASAEKATSVHMSGNVTSGGQVVAMDMTFAGTSSLDGTVSEGGKTFGLLFTDGKAYIKLNKDFLSAAKLPAASCAKVCGKYLAISQAEASEVAGDMSMPGLIHSIFDALKPSDLSGLKIAPSTYDGQPAYTVDKAANKLIVSRSQGYLPLAITAAGDGTLTFTDWNTAVVPGPPPANQTVTVAQIAATALG